MPLQRFRAAQARPRYLIEVIDEHSYEEGALHHQVTIHSRDAELFGYIAPDAAVPQAGVRRTSACVHKTTACQPRWF